MSTTPTRQTKTKISSNAATYKVSSQSKIIISRESSGRSLLVRRQILDVHHITGLIIEHQISLVESTTLGNRFMTNGATEAIDMEETVECDKATLDYWKGAAWNEEF